MHRVSQGAYFLASAIDMGCASDAEPAAARKTRQDQRGQVCSPDLPPSSREHICTKCQPWVQNQLPLRASGEPGGECTDADPLRMRVDTVWSLALWTRSKCLNIWISINRIKGLIPSGPTWRIRNWKPTIKHL